MRYTISGTVMQTVAIDLVPGETVYSQTNCMCWMNDAVDMSTNTGGGFLQGIARTFAGGSLFITGTSPPAATAMSRSRPASPARSCPSSSSRVNQ